MPQGFNCAGCGAPLNYPGDGSVSISCPYCDTAVVVPVDLRHEQAYPISPELSDRLFERINELRELSRSVHAQQPDMAISLYKQVYNVDLENARELVDELMSSIADGQNRPTVVTKKITEGDSTVYVRMTRTSSIASNRSSEEAAEIDRQEARLAVEEARVRAQLAAREARTKLKLASASLSQLKARRSKPLLESPVAAPLAESQNKVSDDIKISRAKLKQIGLLIVFLVVSLLIILAINSWSGGT